MNKTTVFHIARNERAPVIPCDMTREIAAHLLRAWRFNSWACKRVAPHTYFVKFHEWDNDFYTLTVGNP
jgi:hypothetical protein